MGVTIGADIGLDDDKGEGPAVSSKSTSSSSSLMLMKLLGRDRWRALRSMRPSSAARAAERFTWRVLTDAVERTDGRAWIGITAGAERRASGMGRWDVCVAEGDVGGEKAK